MTLILVAKTPQDFRSRPRLTSPCSRRHSPSSQVSQGSANWGAAFALAQARRATAYSSTVCIVSPDGGLPESGLPSLPGDVRMFPLGKRTIISPSPRWLECIRKESRNYSQRSQIYNDVDRKVLLSLYLGDEIVRRAVSVDIPANSQKSIFAENLVRSQRQFTRRSISDPAGRQLLLVGFASTGRYSLCHLFNHQPQGAHCLSQKGIYSLSNCCFTPGHSALSAPCPPQMGLCKSQMNRLIFIVFDGYIPAELPKSNLLLINPTTNPFFAVGDSFKDIKNIQVNEHTLTHYVDWKDCPRIAGTPVTLPNWMNI